MQTLIVSCYFFVSNTFSFHQSLFTLFLVVFSVARSICSKIAGFGDFLSPGQILANTPVLLHFYVTIFWVWHLFFTNIFSKYFSKKFLIEVLQRNRQNCAQFSKNSQKIATFLKNVKNRQFSRKNRRRFFEIFCRQVALKSRRFGDKSPHLAILQIKDIHIQIYFRYC